MIGLAARKRVRRSALLLVLSLGLLGAGVVGSTSASAQTIDHRGTEFYLGFLPYAEISDPVPLPAPLLALGITWIRHFA